MTIEEIKILVKKLDSDEITPEEKLALLKELNGALENMRRDIVVLKSNKKLKEARADLGAAAN